MKDSRKIVIIGGGNIGLALANGLVQSGKYKAEEITITRRTTTHLDKLAQQGFVTTNNNQQAVSSGELIVIAVLPQQLNALLEEIRPIINPEKHLLISVVTGVTTQNFIDRLGVQAEVIRVMPNTAISIKQSMTCLASNNASAENRELAKLIFDTVGSSVEIHEDLMTSATALNACGIAFFLRAIRAASQGGVEIGFHAEEALRMAAQTALGAAALIITNHSHPENEIDKVTSPKGCTIAGLNEMEYEGFSAALIKGIRTSKEKAGVLYKA